MKYELEILTALTQLQQPRTQDIVSVTGISERKVQSVIKSLETDLNIIVTPTKIGRNIHYSITDWGVFESGRSLKKLLAHRAADKNSYSYSKKSKYYDSVKMRNFKESNRLEGITVQITSFSSSRKSIITQKNTLIEKYSKYLETGSGR